MKADRNELVNLEKRFWQSMVDEETDVALGLLAEPSFLVSPHGAMKFDHAAYRKMAEQGSSVIKRYELGEMDVTFVNDGTAMLSYEVKQVLSQRGKSEETEQQMTDTSTWVKVGDSWKCVMHTEKGGRIAAPNPSNSAGRASYDVRAQDGQPSAIRRRYCEVGLRR